jgi:hypothetical protein
MNLKETLEMLNKVVNENQDIEQTIKVSTPNLYDIDRKSSINSNISSS